MLNDDERQNIHQEVWNMTWEAKRTFVRTSIEVRDVKERKGNSETPTRNNYFVFSLKGSGVRYRVCKGMFLCTTGLKSWWVQHAITGEGTASSDTTLNTTPKRVKPSTGLEFVGQFLERLPKMPSHYCRKDTKKLYLETGF